MMSRSGSGPMAMLLRDMAWLYLIVLSVFQMFFTKRTHLATICMFFLQFLVSRTYLNFDLKFMDMFDGVFYAFSIEITA